MAGGIDWFRWHHGSVTDPKFGLIAKKAGARVGDVIAVWALVLESASANDDRGTVGKIDAEAIEFLLGLDDGMVFKILDAMTQRALLGAGGRVESWDKRQPKREDDTAAERKRRQREREHEIRMAAGVTGEASRAVTQSHAPVTHGHDREEKSREEEKREEKDTSSSTAVGSAGAARTAEPKAVALPKDWQLPKAWGDWAMSEFPHWTADIVRLEADKFADHWRAKSGKDARKADWPATWRNWCRSDIAQRAHPLRASGPGMKPGKMTDDERAAWSAAEGEKARRLLFGEAPAADLIEITPTGIPHEAV